MKRAPAKAAGHYTLLFAHRNCRRRKSTSPVNRSIPTGLRWPIVDEFDLGFFISTGWSARLQHDLVTPEDPTPRGDAVDTSVHSPNEFDAAKRDELRS